MSRPIRLSPYRGYPTSIRLSRELRKRLLLQAKKNHYALGGLIVWVLEQYVEQAEARPPRVGKEDKT